MPDKPTLYFEGFDNPTTTAVPDVVFDELLFVLDNAELRVLLYIIRRTFGFKRRSDAISLRQMVEGIQRKDGSRLDRGTGLSKASVTRALRSLQEKGVILTKRNRSSERGNEPTIYALRFRGDPSLRGETRGLVSGARQGVVSPATQGLSHGRDTQQTVLQQTVQSSNIRTAAQAVDNSEPPEDGQRGTTKQATDTTGHSRHVPANPLTNGENSVTHQHTPTIMRSPSRRDHHTSPPEAPTGRTHGQNNGPELLGTILSRHTLRPEQADAREAIESYIKDMAGEFGDKAKLKSSVTRAYNLYEQSGRTLHGFVDALFLARANVRERQDSTTQEPIQNRMSYFFSVLEDQLRLKAEEQATGERNSATNAGSKSPQSLSPPELDTAGERAHAVLKP